MSSLFNSHVLSVREYCAELAAKPDNPRIILFCALLFVLAVATAVFRRKLLVLLRSLYSKRFYSLLIRESKVLQEYIFPVVLGLDLAAITYGIFLILEHGGSRLPEIAGPYGTFGILLLALLLLYLFQMLANRIYASLFDHSKELQALNIYKFIFATNAGILLIPFLFVCSCLGNITVLYGYLAVLAVLVMLFLYRLLKINPRGINSFHFFLYFCTLEILPNLVFAKLLATY